MSRVPRPIREYQNVDLARFRDEIVPRSQPAVLRGAVAHWPAVQAGQTSAHAMIDYLKRFDRGAPVEILVGPPSIGGRFFYQDDLSGMNFVRENSSVSAALDRIFAEGDAFEPSAIAIQSTPTQQALSGFSAENTLDLPSASAQPRIWIGNAIIVAPHFDLSYNLACVVAGRRCFTLFPPEQLANLYVGPLENTPAGTPVSMVSLEAPDFERYPRFEQALAAAQTAELEPGDAIYIPYFWWHQVRSLSPFNVLVNYWWNDAKPWLKAPYASLIHAVLGLRDLPADQRAAWRAMFDYFVFQPDGEALAHIPPEQRGSLAPLTPERVKFLIQILQSSLNA